MIRRIAVLLFVLAHLLTLPQSVLAGAWARGEGKTFLSFTGRHPRGEQRFAGEFATYGEYGLSERLTLGGEVEDNAGARVFLRRSFTLTHGHVAAATLGFEQARSGAHRILTDLGLGWGLGFGTPLGPGWIGVDTRLALRGNAKWHHVKIDALAGLKPGGRWMPMLGLESYTDRADTFVNVVPSLAWRLSPATHVNLRYRASVSGNAQDQIAAALWLEF